MRRDPWWKARCRKQSESEPTNAGTRFNFRILSALKCRSGGLLVARSCSVGRQPYPRVVLGRKMASAAYGSVSGETPMLRRYEDGPDDQSRPAIVFVHGWPDDHRLWDKQVSTFPLNMIETAVLQQRRTRRRLVRLCCRRFSALLAVDPPAARCFSVPAAGKILYGDIIGTSACRFIRGFAALAHGSVVVLGVEMREFPRARNNRWSFRPRGDAALCRRHSFLARTCVL